jgi:hypothetical protein
MQGRLSDADDGPDSHDAHMDDLMPDGTHTGRVSTSELFEAIGDLRTEMSCVMREMREEQRDALNAAVLRLEMAITAMHTQFVTYDKFSERQLAVEGEIKAAVKACETDRQKIWSSLHDVESQLKWAASVVILAFLGIVVWLIQNHA